jgi:hypothetical protein
MKEDPVAYDQYKAEYKRLRKTRSLEDTLDEISPSLRKRYLGHLAFVRDQKKQNEPPGAKPLRTTSFDDYEEYFSWFMDRATYLGKEDEGVYPFILVATPKGNFPVKTFVAMSQIPPYRVKRVSVAVINKRARDKAILALKAEIASPSASPIDITDTLECEI